MARPSKPYALLVEQNGTLRKTKAELEFRRQAEESLTTGLPLEESETVRNDEKAHEYFINISELLETIGKNDGLISNVINRYCLLLAETDRMIEMAKRTEQRMEELDTTREDYDELYSALVKSFTGLHKQIHSRRKMLLDIERESLMTLAAQLRSIPKKPPEKPKSEMAAYLEKRKR